MPNGMMGSGPMQGLSAAQPVAPEAAQSAVGPEQAMAVLQDAVAQYGPEIIAILQQILSESGAAPAAPMGGGMGGMM